MTEKTIYEIANEAYWDAFHTAPLEHNPPEGAERHFQALKASARAVAERCAEIAGFLGVEEDALDKFDWGKGYRAGGNSAALAIRNFIDLKDVLGAELKKGEPEEDEPA